MVKRKALISVLVLFLLAVLALPALAQQEKVDVYENQKLVKSVVFQIGLKEYFVNGQTPGVKMDVAPFIEQGRTFVPVRFLSNALGVTNEHIGWNEKARLVTLKQPGFPVVELVVGSRQLKSNGKVTNMDVSPLVRSGRTFLPARWVAEALGYQVEWDASLGLVVCWPKGEPKPDLSAVKEYLQKTNGEQGSWVVVNGYRVPNPDDKDLIFRKITEHRWDTKAGLDVDTLKTDQTELQLYIYPLNVEAFEQAREVLASKWGDELTNQVINYAMQKKTRNDPLPLKSFFATNGQEITVVGNYTDGVEITVWLPGQGPSKFR
ncbi:copper amine oxidase N-terminal domain-containing protein [Desulfofundulus thermocisternus]|uniref:copper amine oxidase N-terminal domain-containing protein n=1 Tax=Desulfofundulus thermocisternus TaxID=42471 RepID=UPI00217E39BA|nr:copper amine oxidase N-terminal domain-containing protein [Desulfofundulus thermocisternus]MCS5697301.1 copper amine oxidase N-terminal domain-containing protein [Desulfofundulus thermocisternus]